MRAAKGSGSLFKLAAGGYRGYVTVNGRRKYFTAKTKAEAAQKQRDLIGRRDTGQLQPGKVPTVEQWVRHWLDSIADPRPTTRQTHEWVLENRIVGSHLGSTRLDALTVEHIERWMSGLGVKPSSARRYLAPLRAALTAAVKRGHLGSNPVDRMDLKRTGRANTTAMSRTDRDVVLAAATGRNAVRWHLALRLGLRPAEALGLTWPDFDAEAGTLMIRHQLLYAKGVGVYLQDAAKTPAGQRVLRLPATLVTMLLEHRAAQLLERAQLGDWVGWEHDGQPVALMFAQENGRPIQARMDTQLWHELLDSVGLPHDHRYVGRHTAATHLIEDSGGDVAVVAKYLGHADAGFTYRTYVHPMADREVTLAERMDAPYGAPYGVGVEPNQATDELPKSRQSKD